MKKVIIWAVMVMILLTGCQKNNGESGQNNGEAAAYRTDVSTEALKEAVAEAMGEDYWPNMAMEAEQFETMTGVSADVYEEFVAEMPMVSVNVDTFIVLKAKEGQEAAAEEALKAYKSRLEEDTLQYPMNLGKIQASMVETIGQYVCFVQLGADTQEASEKGEDAVIEQCKAANQKAIDAVKAALQE